jgi:hypothetical protein
MKKYLQNKKYARPLGPPKMQTINHGPMINFVSAAPTKTDTHDHFW